jgi:FHA domain
MAGVGRRMSEHATEKSPLDVKRLLEAERSGEPFLLYRDAEGRQQIFALQHAGSSVLIGRDPTTHVVLGWDSIVSSLHARLERTGRFWTLHDDGLSRNGSFVNGDRVRGQRVLHDGDELCFGRTLVGYHDPESRMRTRTVALESEPAVGPPVSPAQKRVLVALCRPYKDSPSFARPASNQQIADELVVSVEAVKSHLRVLFTRFGLDDVPQNEKRLRLAEQALRSGAVQPHEL